MSDFDHASTDELFNLVAQPRGTTDAEKLEYKKSIGALIDTGKPNINAQNADGMTPLAVAVQSDNGDAIPVLIYGGADPSIRNHGGKTPLGIAESAKNKTLVFLLHHLGVEG